MYLLVALLSILLVALKLFDNWRRLRKAPGPFLASITDFWRAYHQYRGQLRGKLIALHKKHGPVVRYGVRSISLSDPGAIDLVYGSRQGFTTAESYKVLIGISNGKEVPSLVSTSDESRHSALRRAVAPAFSPQGVLAYEPFIDETIAELQQVLREQQRPQRIDLSATILFYTIDAAARFSFSQPLGCLRAHADVDGSIAMIRARFNHWGWWSSLPWLERLVYRNPVAMRMKRAPSSMAAAAVGKLKARMMGDDGDDDDGASKLHQTDLLARFIDASRANPEVLDVQGVVGMLMSTISGAGDTTASALIAALYFLMKSPVALRKLREELDAARSKSKPAPKYSEVAKLPYLHAVLRESMRLAPSSTWPIERAVPAGGLEVAGGLILPAGTSAGCMVAAVHLDKEVYGEDTEVFRPERWLLADGEKLRRMEGAFMGFSRGRRVCLGQHVAMLQLKKALSALAMEFDFSPVDTEAELEYDMSPAVVYMKPFYVSVQIRP